MKSWTRIFGAGTDLAIDLGTENTLIQAQGPVREAWNEPSILAYACGPRGDAIPWAAGQSALRLEGRTSETLRTVRPLVDGVIVDLKGAVDMLRMMLQAASAYCLLRPATAAAAPRMTASM